MQDKSDKVAWQWGSRGWMIHLSISAPHGMARQSARATAIGSGTVSVASAITWVAAWEERGGGGRVGAAATACPWRVWRDRRRRGSRLGTGACYDDGVACSPDIRTTKQERRLQRLLIHKDNVHDRRSAHLHGIPRATPHLEMRFAPPPTAFPNHIPPCQPALPPVFHTPQSQPIWTPTFC